MTLAADSRTRLNLPSDWPDLLTPKQIAQISQHHPKTVERLMRAGILRATQRKKNCSWRAHINDVDAWLQPRRPRPVQRHS